MSQQDILQEEISNYYVNNGSKDCYNISVRVGKTRLSILIMQKLKVRKVLILYPFDTIRQSWEDEFVKMDWRPEEVVYSTYLSIAKHIGKYDIIFADEIQKMSEHKMGILNDLLLINKRFLGLSGTYSEETKEQLYELCGLTVNYEYTTEQAIKDGIVADYEVIIKQFKLDDSKQYLKVLKTKSYMTTERGELKAINRRIINTSGEMQKFARINRMQWINKCNSLKKKTLELINELKYERFLLFAGDTKFLDDLGIPTYHNKNSKDDNLELFKRQKINHLGLCQLANQGTTFPNLSHIIITNINSNSENLFQKLARSLLLDGAERSKIYIICSEEDFQIKWLMKALSNVPKNKIIWKTNN